MMACSKCGDLPDVNTKEQFDEHIKTVHGVEFTYSKKPAKFEPVYPNQYTVSTNMTNNWQNFTVQPTTIGSGFDHLTSATLAYKINEIIDYLTELEKRLTKKD